jgi:DNA-binding response OmpR family regulator
MVEASDGMMALEILGRMGPPDLLICDVMMPRVDGFTLVGMIRKKEELRRTPVIFLTAKEGPSGVVQGLHLGARQYIAKPVNYTELLERVNRILR